MLLRTRTREAMARAGLTQARLAEAAGVDRSTVSALLGASEPRLPNAQFVAELAVSLGVSADWLLGLSDTPDCWLARYSVNRDPSRPGVHQRGWRGRPEECGTGS